MSTVKLYFATNRKHKGEFQWKPEGYGSGFSSSGHQNLRFGYVKLDYDEIKVNSYLNAEKHGARGDGEELSTYLTDQSERAQKNDKKIITAFEDISLNEKRKLEFTERSSTVAFREIKVEMEQAKDVVVFIHGFNVSWHDAVGSALSLQFMLNRKKIMTADSVDIKVVLFSWPSDGKAIPFLSYWSDRADAEASGKSIGRGLLTLSNFLRRLREKPDTEENGKAPAEENPLDKVPQEEILCNQDIHLLCHSMGNFALQHAFAKVIEESPEQRLPKIFRHIFLCAPDVDDNVFELGKPMERLHELCLNVSIYFNAGDLALSVSDKTKGNADRLGQIGMSRESQVHRKVHEIDCSKIVKGAVEHSYYLWGTVNQDIRQSIDKLPFDSKKRKRKREQRNSWIMKPSSLFSIFV
ncbi:MAG: alpha/beta hydrolase [candidate division Zixibacteria bacterium]|nr:alpha/beta hydrolase [candidate division Zixibacteria bacterium]